MKLNLEALHRAANEARGLAMDAVQACNSGHLGLPLGCAEIGAALFGQALHYNPDEPRWLNRDRFVLSAGHGSMFLYAWLHLAGYPKMTIKEIADFRKFDSLTPGHPEFGHTPGVEATTGPLGQGVGNALGIAASQKMAAAHFNTPQHKIFDNHVICLCGDGDMQEGVASEASALAAHLKLDNLILIYDSNAVTLDAMASVTQNEDTGKRFEAYGWDVQLVDGHEIPAFLEALEKAKAATGKPQLIIAKTVIGKGIPEVEGTNKAHGEAGAKFVDKDRPQLGLPADKKFFVSDETREFFAAHKKQLVAKYEEWKTLFEAWKSANSDLAELLQSGLKKTVPKNLSDRIPLFPEDTKLATRKDGSAVLQPIAKAVPLFISGSADLHGSTNNYIDGGDNFSADNFKGRNIHFGIREHAMGAMLNGFAYDGIFRPSGATFLVFSDYLRPAIRLAALSALPVIYIFTHDSIGVGEDGPTHQPVETMSGLRVIPNLDVIRPADPEETAGAFIAAVERTDGPTLLALTRQNLPTLNEIPAETRREGVLRGGYVAVKETGSLTTILLSCGSELQLAIEAAKTLGAGTRVVSMPCFSRFENQSPQYRESVLPSACRRRVAIEAGVTQTWDRYVGLDGKVVGLHRFGLSAPGAEVIKKLGITAEAVVEAAKSLK